MRASQITMDTYNSFLLKGPPGFGKTLAVASFAYEGPIWLAYFDKKSPIELLSYLSKMGPLGKRLLDNIEYDLYSATNAGEYLEKLIKLSNDCRYTAVGTDSVTNLTSAAVNWSLAFRDNKKSSKDKDRIVPSWDEYKVETSIVTQALDICRTLPCHVIWTAHPIPGIKLEGSGASIKVTKVNPIVSYGSKVAGIIPGNFSEIYHFTKREDWDSNSGKSSTKYVVSFDAIGDDYAKSNIGLTGELDITNGLFFPLWKERVKQHMEEINNDLNKLEETKESFNPFTENQTQTIHPEQPQTEGKVWNSEKGVYE